MTVVLAKALLYTHFNKKAEELALEDYKPGKLVRFRRRSPVRKDRGRYQMKGCCLSLLETLFLRYSL